MAYNQMTDWKKICATYKTDKELIWRNKKRRSNPTGKWAKIKAENSLRKK